MSDRASWPAGLHNDAYVQSSAPSDSDATPAQQRPRQEAAGALAGLPNLRQAAHTASDSTGNTVAGRTMQAFSAPRPLWSAPAWGGLIKRGPQAGQPRPYLSLNGDVSVPPHPERDDTGGEVDCGPLAIGYLLIPHFIDTVIHSGSIAEVFGGPQHFQSKALDAIKASLRQPEATRQLMTNQSAGLYLSDMAGAMIQSGLAEARILISTGPHFLAIRMSRKQEAGRDVIFVRSYDPNVTGWHHKERIDTARCIDQLKQLSMDQLLPCPPKYFDHDLPLARQCFVATSLDGVMLAPPQALRYMNGATAVAQRSVLERSDIVHRCALDNMPSVLASVVTSNEVHTSNGFEIMRGMNRVQEPAVHTAHSKGNDAFLPMYARALRQHGFATRDAGALIEGRDGDDIPLLFAAAAKDEGALPLAHAESLIIVGITGKDAVPYMPACNPDGVSALAYAVEQVHTNYVTGYGQALKRLAIPVSDAFVLLEARDTQGRPALLESYENDDAEMIHTYHEIMQDLGFPPQMQQAVLRAATPESTGPDVAESEGHTEVLEAYQEVMSKLGLQG